MSTRPEHERIAELLPWFVNGTLGETERRLVERHVGECLPCRMSLEDERRLQQLVRADTFAPTSVDAHFDKLMRRIDRDGPRDPGARRRQRPATRAGLLTWLQLGAAAAVLALLAVGVRMVLQNPAIDAGPGTFSTASDAAAAGARIDIVFADSITETELRALLLEIGGTVVAGPTAIGRYTIALDEPGIDDAALDSLIDRLERDPRIRLAARSYIAP